jgi:hypothetical protein
LASCNANPAQDTPVVEIMQQIGNRRIDVCQTVEGPMAKAAQQPPLDDTNRSLYFRLPSSPGLQFVWLDKRA